MSHPAAHHSFRTETGWADMTSLTIARMANSASRCVPLTSLVPGARSRSNKPPPPGPDGAQREEDRLRLLCRQAASGRTS
jgi:hypothetical protein